METCGHFLWGMFQIFAGVRARLMTTILFSLLKKGPMLTTIYLWKPAIWKQPEDYHQLPNLLRRQSHKVAGSVARTGQIRAA